MRASKHALVLILTILSLIGCTSNQGKHTRSNSSSTAAENAFRVNATEVVSQQVKSETRLPGDLLAYRDVAIYPKVPGYVDWLSVDRGSVVKHGELIARLTAPELKAQRNQAKDEAKAAHNDMEQAHSELKSLTHDRQEAEAGLKADEDTYQRWKGASSYPGIISGNDLEIVQKRAEADRARVQSINERQDALTKRIHALKDKEQAAISSAQSSQDIASYLLITAPFDGVVTERNVHEGSFVTPPGAGASGKPMLRVQQLNVLRLVVPVPETAVSGIVPGATVSFTVPAFAGETFTGTVRRVGHYLDQNTRTMPVELDVDNGKDRLAPGMYAEVNWPIKRAHPSLLVPQSAVAKTTERMFVVKIKNNVVEWVDVKTGVAHGDKVEVVGNLKTGDVIAVRGTDELREGTRVEPRFSASTKKPGG